MTIMASGEHKISLRRDQIDQFFHLIDGRPVEWHEARNSSIFHASANGVTAVCSANVKITKMYKPGAWNSDDRSNDPFSCQKCQELVRRVRRGR